MSVKEKGPHPVDVHVGNRVRVRRTLLGLSQEKLGEKIGLTFQQIQKYERGANRISASRLWHLSRILECPIMFFFEGLESGKTAVKEDTLTKRETLELVRAYDGIKDERVRKQLYSLVQTIAKSGD